MADWHLVEIRRALERRGWTITEHPGDEYRIAGTWELRRAGDDRVIHVDFDGLDDMRTLPMMESYGFQVRDRPWRRRAPGGMPRHFHVLQTAIMNRRICLVAALGFSLACGSGSPSTSDNKSNADAGADPYASCTWDLGTGAQAAGPAPAQDDSADLGGAVIGTQAFDATQERRTVTLNVSTPLPGLTLGQAYLTRITATDENAYLTIPAAYSGTDTPCFIQATNVAWTSATGQKLNSMSSMYLQGSVGAATGTINTDTCLAPGDSGYFIGIEVQSGTAPLYSIVDSIALSLQSSTTGSAPAAKLTPTRYDVGSCSGTRTLRVQATIGGGTAAVGRAGSTGSLGPVVYLDSSGLPAGWTFVKQNQPANFAPGSTTSFYANLPLEPAVSRAQFFLPFDPPNPMFMSLPGFLVKAMNDVEISRTALLQRWGAARAIAASRGGH